MKKRKLTIDDFENLLNENSFLETNQTKWFKSLNEGNISIHDHLYNLKATSNKRNLIYKNGKLVDTSSIHFYAEMNTPFL